MDKRVVILGGDSGRFPSFLYQNINAFKELGWTVLPINFRSMQLHRTRLTNNILNKHIEKKVLKENPDFVLVHKGAKLKKEMIKKFSKQGIKTANWTLDEPFGKFYKPNKIENISEYDYFFVFDPFYLKQLKKINPNSYYLPCAADPLDVHKEIVPVSQRVYSSDLTFIGSKLDRREKLLSKLTDYNLNIWGYRWKDSKEKLAKKVRKGVLTGNKMSEQFNLSKINLNIHYEHSIEGPNLRTFEIPASNSFLLCDYLKELPKLFKNNKEIVLYKDVKDLRKKVDYYLNNESERIKIMKAGHKRVMKEHTIKHRLKTIIKRVI